MRVILSRNAAAYIRRECAYLEEFNPRAARRVAEQFQKAIRLLAQYPEIGEPLSLPGRRRFVSGVYVIDYVREKSRLVISHIRHGKQAEPDLAKDAEIQGQA
ncbi:type II toxin-antitoxin system RelE/ParE family toxin [Affinirhizobium pseudoryzae]|uniref:type II toxin-antitoxin system RelE/ParE family toxin n=1 Tax=Allorhizobium pseudoryzae TaxID=379684 RepID=UPI0013EC6523|nr:type II toxin-antitoxin system RelE/ParE family toxin [Allorhizobium pseudoryzae]